VLVVGRPLVEVASGDLGPVVCFRRGYWTLGEDAG
jgi:hypothetical protein